MGCTNSKRTRCQHCNRPYSPRRSRSYSLPLIYRSHRKSDAYHVITPDQSFSNQDCESHRPSRCSVSMAKVKNESLSLMDSTMRKDMLLGRNQINHVNEHAQNSELEKYCNNEVMSKKESIKKIHDEDEVVGHADEFSSVPRTPNRTPPREPETINAWELMEGLEDNSSPIHRNSDADQRFSFSIVPESALLQQKTLALEENDSTLPDLKQGENKESDSISDSDSIVSDFDPQIISNFRKALEQLSPRSASLLRSPESEKIAFPITNRLPLGENLKRKEGSGGGAIKIFRNCDKKVVIYYTSLRGVRKTFEDCCNARMILKGLGIRVDERDVSMHYRFREELKELLGSGFIDGLPKVFAKGRYIGGAYEIKQMNEEGKLQKLLQGCEKENDDEMCEVCVDVRFVPCDKCSGSCKIYYEDENGEGRGDKGAFVRCPYCNENGILRCPDCCRE
ncbi:hypothetical protein Scep_021887 [Stephania cephalantha]|uniref:Glutaredoxin domain-containing protein n=1 Tax=Stephania cephalantha TaxID=152367 RepID=A0AAP0HX82_9MAGN